MEIKTVGVVGSGTMGNGIAHAFALTGFHVILVDIEQSFLDRAMATIVRNLDRQVKKGSITAAAREQALAAISTTIDFAALASCDMVVEAVIEDRPTKRRVFERLEAVVRADAILASNTSTLSLTEIASYVRIPERVVGMHFMNPAPLMPLVEVISAVQTSSAVRDTVLRLTEQLGKTPVAVKDSPGFVLNRILLPMINEAVCTLEGGVAECEAIDACMKLGANHPMGPLALADLIGLDVCLAILEVLHRDFGDPKYRPAPLLRRMVAAGRLGRKTNRGFYEYSVEPKK